MTKQKQIEEIAKDIHRVCTACSGEMFDEYTCDRCQAKLLIEKGYQKLPKDSVVLSREEICELKYQSEEDFNKAYDLGSKETAEKILQMFEVWEDKPYVSKEDFKRSIADIFGVEIKE